MGKRRFRGFLEGDIEFQDGLDAKAWAFGFVSGGGMFGVETRLRLDAQKRQTLRSFATRASRTSVHDSPATEFDR